MNIKMKVKDKDGKYEGDDKDGRWIHGEDEEDGNWRWRWR